MNFSGFEPQLITFVLVMTRCTAAFLLLPLFNGETIPAQVRFGIAFCLSLAVFPAAQIYPYAGHLGDLLLALAMEFIFGLTIGVTVRLVLICGEVAGEVAGMQMGFSFSRIADPATRESAAVSAQLVATLTMLLLLALNGHHQMLAGLFASLKSVPVGTVHLQLKHLAGAVALLALSFEVGLRMAAPVVIGLLLVNVGLGFLAKLAPQLNIFVLGFSVTMIVGMALFIANARPLFGLVAEQIESLSGVLARFSG